MSNRREGNQVFGAGAPPVGVQTRDVMKDDFGFEIPVESVPLPSGGSIYPQDSALHNAKTIDIRAMTAREEDILTSRALIKKGTVISSLLQSCMVEKGIDPSKMIVGDRNAVMIALRITGYGSEYDGEVDCPSCGAKSKQSFDLSSLSIKPLQIEPSRPGENVFEFFLPVSKKTVQFKFLTGADEEEILVTQERKKKLGGNSDSFVTTRLHFVFLKTECLRLTRVEVCYLLFLQTFECSKKERWFLFEMSFSIPQSVVLLCQFQYQERLDQVSYRLDNRVLWDSS